MVDTSTEATPTKIAYESRIAAAQRARTEATNAAVETLRARIAQPARSASEQPWVAEPYIRHGEIVIADGNAASLFAVHIAVRTASDGQKTFLLDTARDVTIGAKVRACETANVLDVDGRLRVSRGTLIPGSKYSAATFLTTILEGGRPRMFVVHDLAALCQQAQLDPDDMQDMAVLYEALSDIQQKLRGCALLVVGGSESVLADAADRVLIAMRDGQIVTVEARDGLTPTTRCRLVSVRDSVALVPVGPSVP